tara:strand:- start:3760 stop:4350 length:591 start_codon:yes stop_codon:yes gene_type:complete
MRVVILVLFLIVSFQSLTKADNLSDFEIEGVSIGDSLLKKYSKDEIKNFFKAPYYNDNEYTTIESLKLSSDSKYDYISYSYKTNDLNYHLVGIVADIDSQESFNNKIEKCYSLKDNIVDEFIKLFSNSKNLDRGTIPHSIDKTGESKVSMYSFFPNGGYVTVSCYDYAAELNYPDSLRIGLATEEFNSWLNTKAYK